jgi:hypothetical protein
MAAEHDTRRVDTGAAQTSDTLAVSGTPGAATCPRHEDRP